MATLTASDFSTQIVAQARVLDPSFSGEIGTPERKIIDAVAQSLADNQVDLTGLAGALDIDSKYGTSLDRFVTLFGFQRQIATAATGYVDFGTTSPATADISIPSATVLQSNTADTQGQFMQYTTTASGVISEGQTDSGAIPVQCTMTGVIGNTAANTITQMTGNVVGGVTSVTNDNAITNGTDQESDNALKTRFKNTWARNLAGTQSQYLATALAGAYTTKANAIGVLSRYQEYIQIPDYDDAGNQATGGNVAAENTYGTANQWTTAQSDIPYAKQIYNSVAAYVEDDSQDYYYRQNTDFVFNATPLVTGDLLRNFPATNITSTGSWSNATTTFNVTSASGFNTNGGEIFLSNPAGGGMFAQYTSISGNTLSGLTWNNTFSSTFNSNIIVYYVNPYPISIAPNFTFLNVFSTSITSTDGIQALSPGDIVLSEFSYISSASRNDLNHAVSNAVDIYVNGDNPTAASSIFLANASSQFISANNANSIYYLENYRRDGNRLMRPLIGNYFTPLFNSPIDSVPTSITINNQNYYLNQHYWLVHDVSDLNGTIRGRDGLEWSSSLGGDVTGTGPPVDPNAEYNTTGATIGSLIGASTPIEIDNYNYDANIATLQANVESVRQITTDALVHKARTRYFKLDVTCMYDNTANVASTNASIGTSIQAFFSNQYFGSIIQLSDLLETVHEVSGVDNVRWSNDTGTANDGFFNVVETDINGNPLYNPSIQRVVHGSTTAIETQELVVYGGTWNSVTNSYVYPGGTFTLTFYPTGTGGATVSSTFNFGTSAATMQSTLRTALNAVITSGNPHFNISVAQDTRSSVNVVDPVASYTITYSVDGIVYLPKVTSTITSSAYTFNSDFFLLDDELPSVPVGTVGTDTVPGVIIRPRAQNTWARPGVG